AQGRRGPGSITSSAHAWPGARDGCSEAATSRRRTGRCARRAAQRRARREAAGAEAVWVSHAEAEFGLWDMLQREKSTAQAAEVARRIAQRFPENVEIAAYLRAQPQKN